MYNAPQCVNLQSIMQLNTFCTIPADIDVNKKIIKTHSVFPIYEN